MFFIYGTAHRFKRNVVEEYGVCAECGKRPLLQYYTARNCVCFFWIPVLPFSKFRAMRRCPECQHFDVLSVPECEEAVAKTAASAGEAAAAGDVDKAIEQSLELMRLGGFDEARKVLDQLSHEDTRVLLALGHAAAMRWEDDEAKKLFQQVIDAEPDNAQAHFRLGQLLVRALEFDDGLAELRKAVELDPKSVEIRRALMEGLEWDYKWPELVQVMEEIAELSPETAQTKYFTELLEIARKKAKLSGDD